MVRDPASKILDRAAFASSLAPPRRGTLVFTNGVFDILHRGHVDYLSRARAVGDALAVAVNSDASVRRLEKGPDRPWNAEADRLHLLAALECVDWVTLFDEETPRALIASVRPDVLVKGGDYRPEEVVGREEVLAAGGQVEIIPFTDGYSTTRLIQRIRTDEDPA